jgi:molybdate transport system substrate-binding protein
MEEVRAELQRAETGLTLEVAYGSSGTFFAQLANGAPFDLFLSADISYPRELASRGLTLPGTEFIYALGHLVLWVPASSPLDVDMGFDVLFDPGVMHVSLANPEHAPYGRAAEAALRRAGVYERLEGKIVLGENVSQALQFVQSGAAQAGIVALSLAAAPVVRDAGRFWAVPAEWHPPLEQGGVIMREARNPDAARAVRAFLLGPAGRDLLRRFGFVTPDA